MAQHHPHFRCLTASISIGKKKELNGIDALDVKKKNNFPGALFVAFHLSDGALRNGFFGIKLVISISRIIRINSLSKRRDPIVAYKKRLELSRVIQSRPLKSDCQIKSRIAFQSCLTLQSSPAIRSKDVPCSSIGDVKRAQATFVLLFSPGATM